MYIFVNDFPESLSDHCSFSMYVFVKPLLIQINQIHKVYLNV